MRHGISTHGSASSYVVGLIATLLKGIDTPLQALFGYAYISAVLTAGAGGCRRTPQDEN